MRFEVLSPHRDDAAFSLATTLAELASRRAAITLVTCFTWSDWAPRLAGRGAEEVSRVREGEDEAYVRTLGDGARLISLGLVDAPLRRPERAVFDRLPAPEDVARLADLFHERDGGAGVFLPLALGGHLDHRVTRDAGLAAYRESPLAFYEDLPYAFSLSPEEIAEEVAAVEAALGERLEPFHLPHRQPFAVVERSVACYSSQFSPAQFDLMLDAVRARGGERLWVTRRFAAGLDELAARTE